MIYPWLRSEMIKAVAAVSVVESTRANLAWLQPCSIHAVGQVHSKPVWVPVLDGCPKVMLEATFLGRRTVLWFLAYLPDPGSAVGYHLPGVQLAVRLPVCPT